MPAILSDYAVAVYNHAADIPETVWDAWRNSPCNANIMLPHAEFTKTRELAGDCAENVWIACLSRSARGPPSVDLVLSCTEGSLGQYPVFIFTPRHMEDISSDGIVQRLTSVALALVRSVPVERVFSVFAPETLTRLFSTIWTMVTGVSLDVDSEYYAANISYCTKSSFVPRGDSMLPDIEYELRPAREADTMAVAQLCYGFALESPPFVITQDEAVHEAATLINKGQLWLHEIRLPGQAPEIASIVAITRTSSTVAAITKVYTNPRWRQRGCAERLTRKVCRFSWTRSRLRTSRGG